MDVYAAEVGFFKLSFLKLRRCALAVDCVADHAVGACVTLA